MKELAPHICPGQIYWLVNNRVILWEYFVFIVCLWAAVRSPSNWNQERDGQAVSPAPEWATGWTSTEQAAPVCSLCLLPALVNTPHNTLMTWLSCMCYRMTRTPGMHLHGLQWEKDTEGRLQGKRKLGPASNRVGHAFRVSHPDSSIHKHDNIWKHLDGIMKKHVFFYIGETRGLTWALSRRGQKQNKFIVTTFLKELN